MAFSSDKPAYLLFNKKGKNTSYSKMMAQLKEADVVLFGELHNNPICHWLQLEVSKELFQEKGKGLSLAAEMFEADAQLVLDEYLGNQIQERHLTSEGKVWPNYKTDYSPLVDFAKAHELAFVASNIPRRYASLVARSGLKGLEELPERAKEYIAPLPIEVDETLPGYVNLAKMMGNMGHGGSMVAAQAVKDATMAHFILTEWKKEAVSAVLHFNGTYHSNNFEGIYWYLKKHAPELKIVTISTVEQATLEKLTEENTGLADFTICIPTSMTKTY